MNVDLRTSEVNSEMQQDHFMNTQEIAQALAPKQNAQEVSNLEYTARSRGSSKGESIGAHLL
jgi:hypothetical protein